MSGQEKCAGGGTDLTTDWIIAAAASVQALFAGALLWMVKKEHGILKEQAKAIQKQADAQRDSADFQQAANKRAERVAKAQLAHFDTLRPKAAMWEATYSRKDARVNFKIATTSAGGDVIEEIEACFASGHLEPTAYGDVEVEDGHWEATSLLHRESSTSNELILKPGGVRSFGFSVQSPGNLEYLYKLDARSVPLDSDFTYVVLVVRTALGAEAQCTLKQID